MTKQGFFWIDVSSPPPGYAAVRVYRDHWWRVRTVDDRQEALCFGRGPAKCAPQANTDRRILERGGGLAEHGGEIVLLPLAYLPHVCSR